MKVISSKRVSDCCSDNRKSKTRAEPFGCAQDRLRRRIQNRKLVGILAIVVALTTLCGGKAEAQQPGKIFRIGFLDSSTASSMAGVLAAFRQELRKLGWVEGKNITIEYRFGGEQKSESVPELAAGLVRLKVDLIVASGEARH